LVATKKGGLDLKMYFSLWTPQKKTHHEDGILKKLSTLLLCFLVGLSLTACGGSGGGSGGSSGTLSTSLTDSSTDEYQAVYVTIARVDVHHDGDGSWQTVAEPNKTYNLLELVNGVRETLGIATLDAGHYTQMRLIIGETAEAGELNMLSELHPYANYIITLDDKPYKLTVPGGTNTGLKIVNGFDINENQTTELILDFDAMRSVVKPGSNGKYLLKPTVKVLDTTEYSIVSGKVTEEDSDPATQLDGALVTAQIADPNEELDAKDQVVTESGTVADESGDYALFLAPGGYNLVATQSGYLPDCIATDVLADTTYTADFSLALSTDALGSISGTVNIENAQSDQYATIDFRQLITCADALEETVITVKTINVADGGDYSVDLPAGDYQIVASTFNEDTQPIDNVTVTSGTNTQQDITF
jgi:hypothetical protein